MRQEKEGGRERRGEEEELEAGMVVHTCGQVALSLSSA